MVHDGGVPTLPGVTEAVVEVKEARPRRYPRLETYLAGLPSGLASYPECTVKSSLALTLLEGMPSPRPDPASVPEPAARFLARPPAGIWMPEVEMWALALFVGDHYAMSDARFLEWLRYQNRSYLSSLMYRAVMAFLSPAHIVPKAAVRWAAVHRGTSLTVNFTGPKDVEVTLTFPARLFAPIVQQHLTVVFEVVLERSNARGGEVRLAESSETRAVYHARWA